MSFCPNCGTEVESGSKFCGECGAKIEEVQIPVNVDDASGQQQISWEQGITSAETEKMPWEQDVTPMETAKMPWEQDVTPEETAKMPWEQDVTSEETAKMPWEQEISGGTQQVQQETFVNAGADQRTGQQTMGQQEGDTTQRTTPLRPSEQRRVRQQQENSGSSITLKKPNINVKDYANKAKKLTKMQIAVIIEAICLVIVIGVFYAIGSSKSSAEAVAKEYIGALVKRDWSTVYDLTDYPDGKYLQKEQFMSAMANQEVPNISNYEITEAPSGSYYSDSFFGGEDVSASRSSGIQKTMYVEYTVQGQGTESFAINLVKQAEKKMLFFDSWKVTSDLIPATQYYIAVPIGAEVTVNGIALTEDEKQSNEGYGMDEYYVPLFSGTYTLQVALPWFQIYETEFTVNSDGGTSVYDMQLTEDGELAMMAKMQEALEACYQAALEEKDFSEVSDLFMEGYEESAKESYDYLVENLHDSDYYTLKEVTFSDFDCEYYVTESGVSVEMDFDYDMIYQYRRTSYTGATRTEERTDDGSYYMNGSFGYDGETYKLTSINIPSLI